MKHYQVAIIGAGTAGLTARREVEKKTDNYIVIDDGPLGTTCARVGCMPSKVLIQVANDYARRHKFSSVGIHGGEQLGIDSKSVMRHVRSLRDRFVRGVTGSLDTWQDKLVRKRATFIAPNTLKLSGGAEETEEQITADSIIVAGGSRPILPEAWQDHAEFLIDTDQFFEMESLPQKMAVIGLGVIGLELGQALSRLGVEVTGITRGDFIGGLTDPEINDYVTKKISSEFPTFFGGAQIAGTENGQLVIEAGGTKTSVDKVLLAMGRRPNLDRVGLTQLGVNLKDKGAVDLNTLKLRAFPHIFLPGDINADRPLLHEAADEGRIAGYNAVNSEQCFKRRTPLSVTFCDPNIATVGKRFRQLQEAGVEFVTGSVSFEGQGRSIVKLKEQGLLNVYAAASDGALLGAEMQAPDGEHLAHLLAWAIETKLTVFECLKMPFYHPVIEEGLRTALRDCAKKLSSSSEELFRCSDPPIR